MSAPSSVLIAGASAAGLATAEALRRKGYQGALTLLDAESHPPYDRPPLSKQVLAGDWTPDRARLRSDDALAALDAEFLLGEAATGLDAATRKVTTASGRVLDADAVVVATGLRPRTLPGQEGLAGVHVLRTLDDALALREDLLAAIGEDLLSRVRVAVVGDGVLGAEIAATVRGMGLDVTMIGPQPAPVAAHFGPLVAGLLAELHTEHGVELRLGTGVDALVGNQGRVTGVCLADGTEVPADVVVVAVGATPATEWLEGSGLTVDDGVVCDAHCRAAEGVYAVGDIACWDHRGLGTPLRLENRTNATEQAIAVAADILGEGEPYTPVPYLWTDQFGTKVQVFGSVGADAEVTVVDGDPAERRFVALYGRAGRVSGVLGWNMPKQTRRRRALIAESAAWHAVAAV